VKPGRELEDLPAFLTFSQKQWNRHLRGVKEFGRPFLALVCNIFRTLGARRRTSKRVTFTRDA